MIERDGCEPRPLRPSELPLLCGEERFRGLDASVSDFWRWAFNDLRDNMTRGVLAEFLVARALGDTSDRRVSYANFDVTTPSGTRVEVKSAGRLQSWPQRTPSNVVFSRIIARAWDPETDTFSEAPKVRADVFVFAIQTCIEPERYSPTDTSQWEFRVASAARITPLATRSVSLATIDRIAPEPMMLADLAQAVEEVHRENAQGTGVPETETAVVGVDACPGGWIVVQLSSDGTATANVVRRFEKILALDVTTIAVDIPVGLVDESPREADKAAQLFVGARRNSVFSTPIRAVLEFDSHAEANRRCHELTGKGLSLQSFWLCKRMLEVDTWAKTDERIIEVHPEASFCALRREPLRFSKHTPEGLAERRALLEREGIDIPRRPPRAKEDDLLDAVAAAWSAARYAHGLAQPLPDNHRDRIGAIWR